MTRALPRQPEREAAIRECIAYLQRHGRQHPDYWAAENLKALLPEEIAQPLPKKQD